MLFTRAIRRHATVGVLAVGLAVPAFALATAAGAAPGGGNAAAKATAGPAANRANGDNGANGHHAEEHGNSHAAPKGAADDHGNKSNGDAAAKPSHDNGNGGKDDNGNGNDPSKTVDSPAGCPNSFHNSDTGHGANVSGAYDSTCDGSASHNGNGNGNATGKPCAGCVGNADDKNPPGQAPNGSDHNAGYECDRNHGVGRTNPAHTGCSSEPGDKPGPKPHVEKCPDGRAMVDRNHDGVVDQDDCPDAPGKPDQPGNPGNPGHPGDKPPSTPATPSTPEQPSTPATPSTPVSGEVVAPQVLAETVTRPAAQVLPATASQVLPVEADTAVAVHPVAAQLPFTGTDTINLALVADLAMLAGTLAIHVANRRRREQDAA